MSKVITAGSLTPSTVDTPLDARARVSTFSEIANIELPARFMTIVTEDTGRFYQVMKLCPKVIGGIEVENAAIDITDPDALIDLTAIEEARAAAEAARVEAEWKRIAAEAERIELTNELRELMEEAREFDERKADIDGQYDTLTAGNAQNLIGRGEATEEEFTFRPSGDISIQDGTARITKLKGNTVVWNQLVKNGNFVDTNYWTVSNSVTISISNNTATVTSSVSGDKYVEQQLNFKVGHKYLFSGECNSNAAGYVFWIYFGGVTNAFAPRCIESNINNWVTYTSIFTCASNEYNLLRLQIPSNTSTHLYRNIQMFDLTQMFGAGNEPATVEEFEALYPDSYYEYNEGELKSLTATGIKSVGFNTWDEEWTQGVYSSTTGAVVYDADHIRNINPIKVLSNTQYYCESPTYVYAFYYDSDMKFLSSERISESFVTPDGASYMNFYAYYYYQLFGKYQNDICINLSNTGYRNGEYKPYVDFVRQLPIQDIKDSDGNLLFPDGLCSAGTVYDEITEKKAIKRIGKVDLGTLNWYAISGYTSLFHAVTDKRKIGGKIMQGRYTNIQTSLPSYEYIDSRDDSLGVTGNDKYIILKDTSFTDAASLKESLQGVYLYYELETPIEVDLDPEVNMDYEVWDFGTEEMISEGFSTPIKADIIYGFNAVDRIRENTISIEDLITRVAQLESQLTSLQAASIVES